MGERGGLPASRNQTIRTLREIHEGCKKRHSNQMSRRGGHPLSVACACCGSSWPCPDYVDAVAAIDQLDNAEWMITLDKDFDCRLVPDPNSKEHP